MPNEEMSAGSTDISAKSPNGFDGNVFRIAQRIQSTTQGRYSPAPFIDRQFFKIDL